jgi:hypothetical protein
MCSLEQTVVWTRRGAAQYRAESAEMHMSEEQKRMAELDQPAFRFRRARYRGDDRDVAARKVRCRRWRYGAGIVVIDPWNEVSLLTSRRLDGRAVCQPVAAYLEIIPAHPHVTVIIVAHPESWGATSSAGAEAKPQRTRRQCRLGQPLRSGRRGLS